MIGKVALIVALTALAVASMPNRVDDGSYENRMHPRMAKSDPINVDADEFESDHWIELAQEALAAKKDMTLNKKIAKNVIMFLGDGMSISTIKAARVLAGQLDGRDGEGTKLAMEEFPYTGLSKTYCLNAQVPDSACTATAYLRGVKVNSGTIGVSGHVSRGDCAASLEEANRLDSIATWSQAAGKRTGIVTTTTITHASPAGTYAYTAEREWESDFETYGTDCEDIAYQFVYGKTSKNFNVALGGGRSNFLPSGVSDEEGVVGFRLDGRNLIDEWLTSKDGENAAYVWNRTALSEVDDDVDYLLGLFEDEHMKYYLDDVEEEEPTLEEMTEAAIKVLSKGENGYFLFVEGGRIDQGHHGNYARKALVETHQFSKAIQKARNLTSEDDTLIVVTSDHAHAITVTGSAPRGYDILGIGVEAADEIDFPVVSYANGPGYRAEEDGVRYDFSQNDLSDKDLRYPALVPLDSAKHSGEDVGIFASGPWAHLFTGVLEQSFIPHLMAYASCVGNGYTACD